MIFNPSGNISSDMSEASPGLWLANGRSAFLCHSTFGSEGSVTPSSSSIKNSRYWKITNFEFEIDQNLLSPRQGIETKESLKRKYGRGGEGYNHKKLKDRVFNHPE